jgi:hypothetical protein
MKKLLALVLISAPLLAAAAPVNLLVNGSFEATTQANGSWSRQNSISGWTVGANQVEVRNGIAGNALDGHNFVELDVDRNSWISQTIATATGQWYQLDFDVSNRSGVAVASNGLDWSFGSAGGSALIASLNNSGDNQWMHFSSKVQATGSSLTLKFIATGNSDSLGSSLDNVRVSAVPEPDSVMLMLAGLGAMGFVARRRKGR